MCHITRKLQNQLLLLRQDTSVSKVNRSFCQFRRTTWTLLLVVSLLLLRDCGNIFNWTVELLHPLTHLRSVLRHFSLIQHNRTVARASVLWHDINWLIDWLNSTWTQHSANTAAVLSTCYILWQWHAPDICQIIDNM